jgi:hypothetical protein
VGGERDEKEERDEKDERLERDGERWREMGRESRKMGAHWRGKMGE